MVDQLGEMEDHGDDDNSNGSSDNIEDDEDEDEDGDQGAEWSDQQGNEKAWTSEVTWTDSKWKGQDTGNFFLGKSEEDVSNDGGVVELSAAVGMKSEEGSGCSSGKKAVGGGGGDTIDLTNSDDEEDNLYGSRATNSDEEDEQLQRAIARSMNAGKRR